MSNPTYTVQHPNISDFNLTIHNELINIYFNVMQDIHHPFMHVEYVIDSGNGTYDMVYANKTFNICTFLKNRKIDILLQLFMKIAEKFGELPKSCPIPKVFDFFLIYEIMFRHLFKNVTGIVLH